MTLSDPSYFYLVTGFHRSGTSLLAQTLLENGMHMGDELMGATFSNPLGHAEDMPVVRLLDRIYALNGCDWRYHDSSALIKPTWLRNYLETYINKRKQTHQGVSGVKDPRAVHFLDDWQLAGGETIKYIFIYRHWRTAAHSLLNRHSRHLINSSHDIEKHKLNLSFWQQSDLAYKMWLSANQRILRFIQKYPQHCVLLSQQGFVSQSESLLNWPEKIALAPDLFRLRNFKRELLSDTAPSCSEKVLDNTTMAELDAVYNDLQEQADLPAIPGHETRNFRPRHTFVALQTHQANQSTPNIFDNADFEFSDLSWSEFSGVMLAIPPARLHFRYYWEALIKENAAPDDYFSLAKVAHSQGYWIIARVLKIRAILCDCIARGVQAFNLSNWRMFVDEQADWRMLADDKLANANPFSIREFSLLPEGMRNHSVVTHPHAITEILDKLHSATEQVRESSLSTLLLSSSWQVTEYGLIAEAASQYELVHIYEFALFKSLWLADAENDSEQTQLLLSRLAKLYAASGIDDLQSALADTLQLPELSQKQPAPLFLQEETQLNKKPALSYRGCSELLSGEQKRNTASPAANPDNKAAPPKRHRFAVLPHRLSYQKILSQGYKDIEFGLQLDRLNRRLCFLAKDNQQWLQKGVDTLTPAAANSLADAVQAHWLKLWPDAVSEYLFDVECKRTAPDVAHATSGGPHNKCLMIYDIDYMAFRALAALMLKHAPQCRVHLLLSGPMPADMQCLVDELKQAGIDVCHSIEAEPVPLPYLLQRWQSMGEFKWFAAMSAKQLPTLVERRKQLMRWYAMLAYEFDLDHCLDTSGNKAAMRIPSYAPEDLNALQKKPLFYPDAGIFWINRRGLECIDNINADDSHIWMIKMLQNLKTQEADLACTHQFFLKYFE